MSRRRVDVARLAASQAAFVTVCSILGALATTGDIYQDRTDSQFLAQEAEARARMIGIAEKLGKASGRRRAMRIIELASGQVESVAEARVLWIIRAFGLPDPICGIGLWSDAASSSEISCGRS